MSDTQVDNPINTFLCAVGSIILFSIMNMFVKLASIDYSVAQIIFFRSFLAFIPVIYMISRSGGLKLIHTRHHAGHFWRSLVGVIGMFCFFLSFAMLPLANATSIHFAAPLILTVLSIFMLGERVGAKRWSAVAIGLLGVIFMIRPFDMTGVNLLGSLIAIAAAFLAAFAMIFVRKLGRTEHALTIVFYFTLYGSLFGGIAMLFTWQPIQADSFFYLLLCGILGGGGQILLTNAYAHAPSAYVAPFSYLSMVFAVAFDVIIWGILPDFHIILGSLIIIASGLFIVYRESKDKVQVRTNLYGLQPAILTEKDKEGLN